MVCMYIRINNNRGETVTVTINQMGQLVRVEMSDIRAKARTRTRG